MKRNKKRYFEWESTVKRVKELSVGIVNGEGIVDSTVLVPVKLILR